MTRQAICGTLVISIDMTSATSAASLTDEATRAGVDTLLGMLRDARMPATWADSQPASSVAVKEILSERAGHEIALRLAMGESSIRGARELKQKIGQGRPAHPITTVLTDAPPSADLLKRLAQLGIASVATATSDARSVGWLRPLRQMFVPALDEPTPPHMLRYGLWHLPATPSPGSRSQARRALENAAACDDVLHVALGLSQASRAGGMKRFEALLNAAYDLRTDRRLAISTVADIVSQLRQARAGRSAQSILRPAA
jgi:hypothetical protein